MMDEKLHRRIEAIAVSLVVVAYFLPWTSLVSAFGSIQLRGLFIDYAWIVLLVAVTHLLIQAAESNREALGLPESSQQYLITYRKFAPFVLVAAMVWYGLSFTFNMLASSTDSGTRVFGIDIASVAKARLDYGYWTGMFGSLLLVTSIGLRLRQAPRFALFTVLIVGTVGGLAFGLSRFTNQDAGRVFTATDSSSTTEPSHKASPSVSEAEFDSAPYVQVVSVTGSHRKKNYDLSQFSNSVIIAIVFRNVSGKTIVGLRGYLTVLDGFGKEVYTFSFRDDDKLLPGRESRYGSAYSFDDNQFMDDQPYDLMIGLIVAETARYSVKITKVAFDDGSILPANSENK